MRSFSALVVFGLASGVCRAGEAPPAKAEREKRRARTQELYNDVYNRNILVEPREAEPAFEKVQRRMEEINPDDPGDPAVGRILFQRGYLAVEAGEFRKAIALFEELLKRFPRHAYADDALYQIGYIHQRNLRDYDRAAEAYSRLAKKYKDYENAGAAYYQSAQIAVQQQRIKQATGLLNDAVDNTRRLRLMRGQRSIPNYYEKQSNEMLRFIEDNSAPGAPTEPLALYLQGWNVLQEGRLEEAEKSFAVILKRYSGSKLADDAAFGLAECRRLGGKFDDAAEAYESFVKNYSRSELVPRARFQLAEFKRLSGNEKQARRLYEAVIAGKAGKGEPAELRRVRTLARRRLEELSAVSR